MRVAGWKYQLPKLGNPIDHNEDVGDFTTPDWDADPAPAYYALSDGATTSAFAQEWATDLVAAVINHGRFENDLAVYADKARPQWEARLQAVEIPWYAEAKIRAGAFATLLVMALHPPADDLLAGRWEACAIGDCCLFQVRDAQLQCAFPLTESAVFGTTPDLIASRSAALTGEQYTEGGWQRGDHFYLMSDALAAWFLREKENNAAPWAQIADWRQQETPQARFAEWIGQLRAEQRIRNDDVTLMIVEINQYDTITSS